MASPFLAIQILAMILLAIALPVIVVWGVVKGLQGLFWGLGMLARGVGATVKGVGRGTAAGVRHVGGFARDEIVDALRFGGGILTAGVILPLAFLNFCLGRWSSASHFGRALEDEIVSSGISLYRVVLGNPARLFGLGLLTDGIERRLPDLVARAPQPRRKSSRPGRFEGYKVVGMLPAGGSGAQLYLAKPKPEKLARLREAGHPDPGQVVIKSFALSTGSTLPQIVRESRALEAASRLGLVLEHELADQSFHYVMPFVPGDRLDEVISEMHARAGSEGLGQRDLGVVIQYASDLLQTLDRFHAGGLWHKDIKPGNLIVSGHRVHLVDLGLVTPLASAMTLTTHGTEYFRDPEMVRLALRGVKVHEVDGVRFDLYSAGAVLYAMIENSFPAHGSLSQIGKRCPEALKWIVRRAMADLNARYSHAFEMLADLRTLAAAPDPFGVRPADLPSVSGLVDWSILGGARPAAEVPAAARPAVSDAPPRVAPAAAPATGTPANVRRRTSRSILAAAVWMLFVGGSLGSVAVLVRHARSSHAPRVVLREHVPMPSRGATDPGAQRLASLESAWAHRLRPTLEQARPAQAASSGTPDGRVLVLDDLGPASQRGLIDALRSALSSGGFEVLGGRGPERAGDAEIELEAQARSQLGLGDPGDADAVRRLEEFLDERTDLDAILWVAPGEDRSEVQYRLLLQRDGELEAPQRFSPELELELARSN